MLENINEIVFVKKSSFTNIQYFHIKIFKNENILSSMGSKYNEHIVRKINDDKLLNFIDKLLRITNNWKNMYELNNAIDGFEWKLSIKFNDGYCREYFGNNLYPDNFKSFEDIIFDLIEEK